MSGPALRLVAGAAKPGEMAEGRQSIGLLLVTIGGPTAGTAVCFGLPVSQVHSIVRVADSDPRLRLLCSGQRELSYEGAWIPVHDLAQILGCAATRLPPDVVDEGWCIVGLKRGLNAGGPSTYAGLIVESVIEIADRPLEADLAPAAVGGVPPAAARRLGGNRRRAQEWGCTLVIGRSGTGWSTRAQYMKPMDQTRSALFSQFREEVDTHLLRLSQGVVAIEQDPTNAELLKEIFRAAHTIKGAAKMMGFPEIAHVTHEMELVLGAMRDGKLRLTNDISDLLFEGIDAITGLIQLQANPGDAQAAEAVASLDPERILRQLRELAGNGADAGPGAADGTGSLTGLGPSLPPPLSATRVGPTVPANVGPSRPEQHLGRPELAGLNIGDDSVRVRVQKLDTLMHLSGEMVITKMQHQLIVDHMQLLLGLERHRSSQLTELINAVQRSWGALNQADMEEALQDLRTLTSGVSTSRR